MVSLINFGGLKQVNGRTISSGSQTGLDIAGIVEQLATAKRMPAVKFEDNIKINNNKISALTDMKSKLNALKTAVSKLRNPVGFGSTTTNSFESRTAFLTMSTGDTAANYVGVSASNGAPIGKFNIAVTQLAVAQTDLSESFASLSASVVVNDASGGPATGKFNAGTFNINYNDAAGLPQSQSINLTAGANLATVRDTINAKSNTTGVKATIIKFSDTDYRLKVYASETGEDHAFTFTNNTGTKVNFTSTPANNAEFTLDNETIIRGSNIIDDLIPNTTLTLYQETGAGTVTLDIDKDNPAISQGLADFLTAYNDFRMFTAQQTEYDENGKLKDTAYLSNDPVLAAVRDKLTQALTSNKGVGLLSPSELSLFQSSTLHSPTSLGDLGIYFTSQPAVDDGENSTPAVDNLLEFDVSRFNDNLQKYFSKTRELFEFGFTSDNSEVASYKRSNAIFNNNIGSFTLNIDHDTQTVTATNLTDPSGNPLSPSSAAMTYSQSGGLIMLKGGAGGVLDGMEFFFTGTPTVPTTANITVSQGAGDVMFNSLDSFIEGIDGELGSIDQQIENLKTQNESAQDSIDRIDERIVSYRDLLLNKFSALEALVNASNQSLMLLGAQTDAQNNG